MPPRKIKARGVYKGVLRQERTIAKKEVQKAKKKIKRKGKWTVAADVFGYHAGYNSKSGMFAGKGRIKQMVQPPAQVRAIPASSSHIFKVRYDRKPLKNGLRVMGIQKIGDIGTVGGGTAAAFVIGGSQVSSFYLSPDSIGGQMALDARNYTFFKFRKVRLIMVMNAPSTDSYGVGIAFVPDPQIGSFQTVSYATIQQNKDIVTFTRKQTGPVTLDVSELRTAQFQKYNTESDTTSDMSKRASYQGIFYGFYNAADAATNTTYGDMLMEFELDLYNRAPDFGFTLQLRCPVLVGEVAKLIVDRVDRAVKDAERKERDQMRKDGGCDEKTMVIFNKDPAWRKSIVNRLIGRYEGQMKEALSYAQIGIPRVGTGFGAVAAVSICDSADTSHRVLVSANQAMSVGVGGTLAGDPVPIDYGGAGLGMPIDVASINGAGTAGNAGYMPSQQFVDIGGGTINAVTGLSASGPVTSVATSIRDAAQPRYANVSTSSSLQTVVSATESKNFDKWYVAMQSACADLNLNQAQTDKAVSTYLEKRGLAYAAPEKVEVIMNAREFDNFKDWVKVRYSEKPKEKPPEPTGK